MGVTRGDWHGLPGRWFDDLTAVDGQRFIASLWSWRQIKAILAKAAKFRCEECGSFDEHGDGHHVYGRGIGGSKRDDRPVVWLGERMVRMIQYLCRGCHKKAVIKPWGSWRNDVSDANAISRSAAAGSAQ